MTMPGSKRGTHKIEAKRAGMESSRFSSAYLFPQALKPQSL